MGFEAVKVEALQPFSYKDNTTHAVGVGDIIVFDNTTTAIIPSEGNEINISSVSELPDAITSTHGLIKIIETKFDGEWVTGLVTENATIPKNWKTSKVNLESLEEEIKK